MHNDPKNTAAVFPETCWSRVLAVPVGGSEQRRVDLEQLAQAYWRPVYGFVRTKWRMSPEEAMDRAQDFFVWMFEGDFLAKADPSRGRFRAFLKTALQNYLVDHARRSSAQKRGGDIAHLSIGPSEDEDLTHELVDGEGLTPEQVLDQRWRTDLVRRALEQVAEEFTREGRAVYYDVFEAYFVADDEESDYRALAERHGITATDVSNYLRKAKARYRTRLRNLVQETVSSEEELQEELHWLFGSGE